MAPQPDNDNTPKAPDKSDKTKADKHGNSDANKEKNKDFKTLNNLNDCELKDLLDEAITYKNPKDREGKSTLFKELLSQAEESERNARAASAGGSEQVRYCNTSAKRSKHRRKPNSISENVMHGGSLDNLAKEDLFEVAHHLSKPKRTVSARQREGGSLPSNVNAGSLASYDPHFLEEARRKRTVRGGGPPEPMEVDMERANLLDHDSVAENYEGGDPPEDGDKPPNKDNAPKFTTKATLQVNVDDPLSLESLERKHHEVDQISAKVLQTKYSVYIQDYGPINEAGKKVDENGNALHQNQSSKAKKKKVPSEKNVMTSYSAEKLEGHRSEIINDIDKLLAYIGDGKDSSNTNKQKKQSHKNSPDESTNKGGGGKKQKGGGGGGASQAASSKNSKGDLKKSNSLEEISTTKMNSFKFDDDRNEAKDHQQQKEEQEKPKGAKNETVNEKPKVEVTVVKKPKTDVIVLESPPERRNREAVEQPTVTNVPKAAAPAPSEATADASADFRVVTKKKKTKKRRNSVSGSRHKPSTGACSASAGSNLSKLDGGDRPSSTAGGRRASSPAKVPPRRKSVCSVPQSDKSNDSSDADSVHSLPAGGASCAAQRAAAVVIDDAPISYADIARNADRRTQDPQVPTTASTVTTTASSNAQAPKKPAETQSAVTAGSNAHAPKKFADAKVGRDSLSDQGSPPKAATSQQTAWTAEPASTANAQTQTTPPKEQQPPPDVHNIRSFPAIGNNKGTGGGGGTIKVDRSVNTAVTRSQVGVASGRSQQQQQQQQAERQRVAQCNAANSSASGRTVRTQTVGTSMQTNNVPEQQQPQRDIKTDLSIIQANEMETVQYNNQMMPRMEIPDVQTIEKLNYMSQPGAHMPLHLQHHVVPPQHLHMAPPPQQRPPSQPPHHIPMMMQPPPPPDMYHPHHHHPQQVYNPVMTHPHHHPHHHNQYHPQQHHHLAYSPQAYEGVAVTYAVDPAYMPQGGVVGQHHQMMGGVVDNRSQEAVQNAPREKTSGRWADDNANKPPKSSNNKKRFDKSHNPVDRRKDNVAPSRSPSQPTSHSNQAVIASAQRGGVGPAHHHHNNNNQSRRGGRGAEPARRDEANCDNHDANASNDCGGASSGDETGSDRPPPVVILSGSSASRDVPGGIEFGFAVNPDLVDDDGVEAVESSDPCEVFDRYYRPPDNSGAESYNHDKVVHYIGSTWEDILNSGTAQYYSSPRNPNNNNNNNN